MAAGLSSGRKFGQRQRRVESRRSELSITNSEDNWWVMGGAERTDGAEAAR